MLHHSVTNWGGRRKVNFSYSKEEYYSFHQEQNSQKEKGIDK